MFGVGSSCLIARVRCLIHMVRLPLTLLALAVSSSALPSCTNREGASSEMALTQLLPERIAAWTRHDSAVSYDRETIFDYIDGAGEVYRSYAFSQVAVAVYSSSAAPDITVELFDKGNAADAYGVFSYAREQEEMGIGGGYEHKGRVLCFWQDRFYVCVASDERTTESDAVLQDFARTVSQQLPPASDPPDLVAVLPAEGRVPFSERFFHLHQSLNYHYYLARDNLLDLSTATDAVLARYEPGATYLLIVRYESERAAVAALSSFGEQYLPDAGGLETVETENGKFVSHRSHARFVVVVLDADSEMAANSLLEAAVTKITGLPG